MTDQGSSNGMDILRQVLGAFYKTVDVMKSARNSESKMMNVWAADMKAVEDVMFFLEQLRDADSAAQCAQEPVAWQFQTQDGRWTDCGKKPEENEFRIYGDRIRPLYTSPPSLIQAALTDDQRDALERMAGHDPRNPGLSWDGRELYIQSAAQAASDALEAFAPSPVAGEWQPDEMAAAALARVAAANHSDPGTDDLTVPLAIELAETQRRLFFMEKKYGKIDWGRSLPSTDGDTP